nr:DNA repair protein Rad4 containing protein [Haemonchus contortus]
MQPLRTSDDENFKEETGTNAAGESVETAHPVTTERASSNKENEVEDNDFVDNVRKIETASRSAPRKKKVKSKELSGSDEKDSPKDEMCDVVSNHDVAEQDLKPKSSTGRDVSRTATKRKRSEKAHSDAPMSDGEGGLSTADVDSDDSDFSPSHRSKQSKKRSTNESGDGKQIRKKCSKSERKQRSEATPETEPASSSKPGLEPRQESNEPIVRPDIFALPSVRNEIAALPKDLSPAEAIEEKFRIYAAAVAIGRNLEISLEEANQAIRELKMLCESRSAAPVTVQNSEEMDEYASSSEDEWEEMELVEVGEGKKKDVEVTVEGSDERNFESLWLRREVNRCVRENWENCHRVNILCYIAHLQHLRKDVLEHNLVSALMLSTIPPECENVFGRMMSVEIASKVVEHYKSTFKASDKSDGQYTIEEMVSLKVYNNDADRAVIPAAVKGSRTEEYRRHELCCSMSGIPRWWPYRVPIEVAVKKTAVAVVGVIVGANVVSYYWKPMQDYEDTLNRGKIELNNSDTSSGDRRNSGESGGSDHYGSDGDLRSTLFKRVFKMYKRRAPPPDLSGVLDPSSSSEFGIVNRQLLNSKNITASELKELGLKPLEEWNVKTLKDRLGLYIIPNVLR